MGRGIGILVVCAALVGCAATRPPEFAVLSESDYGPEPVDARALVADHLKTYLKDPYSAQIEVLATGKVMVGGSLLTAANYGWGICATVNAKNSYGAYVGFRKHALIWRQSAGVLAHYGRMPGNMFDEGLANGLCKQIGA